MEYVLENINLKNILRFFAILILLLVVIFITIVSNKKPTDFIIIDESCILTKKGNKWLQIKELDENILSKKYTLVSKNQIKNNVKINYTKDSNLWTYFDNQYNDLNSKDVLAAYTKKFNKLKVADYSTSYYDENDDEILMKALGDDYSNINKGFIFKYSYDLDNDGTTEIIYTITGQSLSAEDYNSKSTIFLVKNGEVVGKFDNDDSPYRIISIVDLDGDGFFEVVVNKGDIDMSYFDSCYQIYNFKNGKINRLMGCN